jgi:hypothetical protein
MTTETLDRKLENVTYHAQDLSILVLFGVGM